MGTDADLLAGFESACSSASAADSADLRTALREQWDTAMEAWPDLSWDPRQYAAFLGARVHEPEEPGDAELSDAVRAMRGVDLFIAGLAATGDRRALSSFDAQFLAPLDKALSHVAADASTVDEVRQQLRAYLFSGEGKIAAYSGRAGLPRWIQVAAVRTFHKLGRRVATEVGADELLTGFAEPGDDPDLEYFKRLYRAEFKEAFADAIAGLSKRERNLLRHAVLDGLTADQIGRVYHVSRSTAARQVAGARAALVDATRARLRDKLELSVSELQSVLRVIQSEVDVSVRRVLGGSRKTRRG